MANDGYTEVADAIVEFLLYVAGDDREYTNLPELQQHVNYDSTRVANAVRWIITSRGAMEYTTRPGVYRIVDLERYFEEPDPGANKRWRQRYVR